MSITATDSTKYPPSLSIGPVKIQVMDFVANSGETAGTIAVPGIANLQHILMGDSGIKHSAAPTFSGNTATLAFTVPAETAASLAVQDITYTAVANLGAEGNDITIAYTAGGTAGEEVVTVAGTAISVEIEDGVSTATEVLAAVEASAEAMALVGAAITGTAGDAQDAAAAAPLADGVTGGARGSLIAIGR